MSIVSMDNTEDFARGDKTRREVLGDAHVDRSLQNIDEFMKPWRQFATESSWGRIWPRPGLDLKTRSICTVSALVATGELRELRIHLKGLLRLGVTPAEVAEMFIQIGSYAGMPRAGSAFEIAREVLAEMSAEAEA